MSTKLSRALRFIRGPQQQSIIEKRPRFTVPELVRQSLEKNNPGDNKDCGWIEVAVRDLDTHFQPQVWMNRVMWSGRTGSGEIHFVDLPEQQLSFFVQGHQYLIEILTVDGRVPNSRETSQDKI